MSTVDKQGWLIDQNIKKAQRKAIEHSAISAIKAIVLHRTGTATAQSVLNAWDTKAEGTHFLISEDGSIYQTASLLKQCWHVGKLHVKCATTSSCSAEDAAAVETILHSKNLSWGKRFKLITDRELKKDYPVRFPHNHDSIGIEVVGVLSRANEIYELPNKKQLESLFYLIDKLVVAYGLSIADIYAHGKIAHKDKNQSEGASSLKAYSLHVAG